MKNEVDISVSDVAKDFSSRNGTPLTVIQDITLEVRHGELVVIVGPSGCGKTTLLRVIQGLLQPSRGDIWINPDRRREGAAYVQQSAVLLPWRTLFQNVALGLEVRERIDSPRQRFLHEEIVSFGLEGFEDSLAAELSGGMRQRAALIRALASRPKLLFCDEPFSAIDFVTRLRLNTRFKFMCRVQGITTIFVTHNIEEAIFLGDRVLVMSGRPGRVVAEYEPDLSIGSEDAVECRKSPEFSDLFSRIWEDLRRGHEGK